MLQHPLYDLIFWQKKVFKHVGIFEHLFCSLVQLIVFPTPTPKVVRESVDAPKLTFRERCDAPKISCTNMAIQNSATVDVEQTLLWSLYSELYEAVDNLNLHWRCICPTPVLCVSAYHQESCSKTHSDLQVHFKRRHFSSFLD